jgi:hypothetical protein
VTALDKVLLAADLMEPSALGGAHEHLMKECPWYRNISEEKNCGHDPAEHCKPKTVKLTPRTPEASTVPEPVGKPGGPGLWHVKGMQLPPYVQHLAHHLIGKYGESRAIAMAKGIVAKWKAGIAPGGKKGGKPRHVHADVQAAAAKNIAQWEEKRARAHAQSREHERGKVKATVALASPVATAPGAAPVPRAGMLDRRMAPVTFAPRPKPPEVKLPTAAEVRGFVKQVPDCSDAALSKQVRTFLETASVKLSKEDTLGALAMLRSAQTGIYAAHKADLGAAGPAAMTANVFKVPAAEQSSANAAMIRSRGQEMSWRKLEQQVAGAIDRIRRKHFRGAFPAGMQQARFAAESSLDRVVRLSGGHGP